MSAASIVSRAVLLRPAALLSRLFSSAAASSNRPHPLFRSLRPLAAVAYFPASASASVRCLATRTTSSSLNDPSPNWSNRPPKETILLDGCDFEHWLVVMEKPEGDPTRDEIIDSYIKTLAQIVGSEEEARMKIYSVSTRHYFAFGALVSEELSYKLKELPRVRWVLPDSYLDVRNKDYGGEPFINGQAVPYDPKYHEEWVRNNARANERNRRNDRPRNFDRSRNFDRRRENATQNRDFQNQQAPPPMGGQGVPQPPPQYPQHNMGGPGGPPPPNNRMGPPPPPPNSQMEGWPQNNVGGQGPPPPPPNNQMGGSGWQQNNVGGQGPPPPTHQQNNQMGGWPQNNAGGHGGQHMPPPNNPMSGAPQNSYGGMPQTNAGRVPPPNNTGWSNGVQGNFQSGVPPNNAGVPSYQGEQPNYPPNAYPPNRDGNVPRY